MPNIDVRTISFTVTLIKHLERCPDCSVPGPIHLGPSPGPFGPIPILRDSFGPGPIGPIHLGPGQAHLGPFIWARSRAHLGPFIWARPGPICAHSKGFIWALLGPGPLGPFICARPGPIWAHAFGPGPIGPIWDYFLLKIKFIIIS